MPDQSDSSDPSDTSDLSDPSDKSDSPAPSDLSDLSDKSINNACHKLKGSNLFFFIKYSNSLHYNTKFTSYQAKLSILHCKKWPKRDLTPLI